MDFAIGTSVTWATAIVWLLELVKRSNKIPWVTAESDKLNRLIMVAASVLATSGIRLAWSGYDPGPGDLMIHVTGLTMANAIHLVGDVSGQAAITQAGYLLYKASQIKGAV